LPYLNKKRNKTLIISVVFTFFIAISGLLGYLPGMEILGSIHEDYIPMAPSTAFSFIVLCICLITTQCKNVSGIKEKVIVIITLLVTLFGILEVLGYFSGLDLNFEDKLIPIEGNLNGVPIGRMSPVTGALFSLTGITILFEMFKESYFKRSAVISLIIKLSSFLVLAISFIFCVAYLAGSPLLYDGTNTIPVAMTTALGFLSLSISILLCQRYEIMNSEFNRYVITGFVLIIIMVTIVEVISIREIFSVDESSKNLYEHPFTVSNAVLAAQVDIIGMHRYMKDVALAKSHLEIEKAIALVDMHESEVYKHFNIIFDRFLGDRGRIETVHKLFSAWKPIRTEVIELTRKGKNNEAALITKEKGAVHVTKLTKEMDGLVEFAQNKANKFYSQSHALNHTSTIILYVLMFGILITAICIGYYIIYKVDASIKMLKDSEEKYKAYFNLAVDGYVMVDAETGIILDCNNELARMIKRERSEIIGDHQRNLHPKEEAKDKFSTIFNKHIKDENAILETEVITKEGKLIPVEIKANSFVMNEKKILQGFFRDITQRKESEEEISIFFNQPMHLHLIVNFDGTIYRINRGWQRILGFSQEEIVGKQFIDFVHPDDIEKTLNEFNRLGEGITTYHFENRYRHKDGSYRTIAWSSSASLEQRKVFAVGSDITERIQIEQTLHRSQKMESIGHLAGGIAHDFNNLLGIIQSNLEFLQEYNVKDEEYQKWINTGLKTVKRGANLTKRLLTFSKKDVINTQVVNINEFINELRELLSKSLTPIIKLDFNLGSDVWYVDINTGEFQDALVNLAINAHDAMPDGGTLQIRTTNKTLSSHDIEFHPELLPGQYVLVSVSDTGCGMNKEVMEHIFEPFYTTKGKNQGTGLGLSMVYGFAKRSRGSVKFYSEEGHGTTVRIYLPVVAKAVLLKDKNKSGEHIILTGSELILVVDDEEDILLGLKFRLESLGYTVLTANNGQEALKVINNNKDKIDLLLSDVVMPGMTGYELVDEVKKKKMNIKVLLASGFTDNIPKEHVLLNSNLKVMEKPYTKLELSQNVREALDSD
jgi:PAS domain S-box-containing protein